MSQSRLAVTATLIHELLHLPPDVTIVGAEYESDNTTIDLTLEGPSLPEADRLTAIVHKESIRTELKAWRD